MAAGKRRTIKKFYESHAEKLNIPRRLPISEHNEMILRAKTAIENYKIAIGNEGNGSLVQICNTIDAIDDLKVTEKTYGTVPVNFLLWILVCSTEKETPRQGIYEAIGKSAYDFSRLTPKKGDHYSIWDSPISRNAKNLIVYNADATRHKVTWKKILLDELITAACFAVTGRKMACESKLIHGMMLEAMPQMEKYLLPYPTWIKNGLQSYTASFSPNLFPSSVMLFVTFQASTLLLVIKTLLLSLLRVPHTKRRSIENTMLVRLLSYLTVSLCDDFEKSQEHAALFGNYKLW